MDSTQWAQGIGLLRKPMEEELLHPSSSSFLPTTTAATAAARAAAPAIPQQPTTTTTAERKARPQKEQALHCPRCNSTNTKFCYYNNYSLTQPRYFCKACRRYWTEGGSLRNVPVGGGSRKNKRHSSSSSNIPASSSTIKNLNPPPPPPHQMSSSSHQHFDQVHDLNLAFPSHNSFLNLDNGSNNMGNGGGGGGGGTGGLSAMELLRSSGITARGLGPLVPMSMSMPMQMPPESMYPYDGGVGASGMQEGSGRLLFPFGDTKQEQLQHRGQGGGEPPMFWNGMMGGGNGSSW